MKTRDRAKGLLRRNPNLYDDYVLLRNATKALIRRRKRDFICKQIIECKVDCRKLCKVLSPLGNTKKNSNKTQQQSRNNINCRSAQHILCKKTKKPNSQQTL